MCWFYDYWWNGITDTNNVACFHYLINIMALYSVKTNNATRAINQFSIDSVRVNREDYLSIDLYLGRDTDHINKITRRVYPQLCVFLGYTTNELDQINGFPGIRWNG